MALNDMPLWYGDLYRLLAAEGSMVRLFLVQAILSAWLILPATIPLGMLFPVINRAYDKRPGTRRPNAENTVGRLYFSNTLGAMGGCLLTGFWALPNLGVKNSLVAMSLLLGGLALYLLLQCRSWRWRERSLWAGTLVVVLTSILVFAPPADQQILNAGLYSDMVGPEQKVGGGRRADLSLGRLLMFKEGINNSVAVVANKFNDGNLTLHLTGHWVSTTEFHGRLHLRFLGHLPLLFARRPETVAVIGYGTGITTGTVLLYPEVKRVDVFELESGVIEATKYFDFINHRPLEDSRIRVFTLDGRSHLAYEPSSYDVITADPIHPFVAGAANLYSQDFYRIVARRLNDEGVFCQWIPLVAISEDSFKTILNSIHSVFPHTAIFTFFGEAVVIASREPLARDWETFISRLDSQRVHSDFASMDILSPYNLGAFLMGAGRQIDAYLQDTTRINTDDNVWLEHHIPQDLYSGSTRNLFFELNRFFGKNRDDALQALLPGLDLNRMQHELAQLTRNGDQAFQLAAEARERKDRKAETHYLWEAYRDFNSRFYYPAGLRLAEELAQSGRSQEAYAILHSLQFYHPAFAEAFQEEARLRLSAGGENLDALRDVIQWGLRYNPDDETLQALRRQIPSESHRN
jgi:spermidine synthase